LSLTDVLSIESTPIRMTESRDHARLANQLET
jgi:hypothetical protein